MVVWLVILGGVSWLCWQVWMDDNFLYLFRFHVLCFAIFLFEM